MEAQAISKTLKMKTSKPLDKIYKDVQLPEILEHLFSFLKFKMLKTSRLVNSIWNTEACRLLRKKSMIYLWEGDTPRLKELEKAIKNSEDTGFPLPFEFFQLEAQRLQNPSLLEILADERLFPLKVIFNRPPNNGYAAEELVEKLLQEKGQHLQFIHFTLGSEKSTLSNVQESTPVKTPFWFPKLEKIQLLGNSAPHHEQQDLETERCQMSDALFISRIINSAPLLTSFESSFCSEDTLVRIFCNTNLSNVEDLRVFQLTPSVFKRMRNLSIPHLKTFYALINPDLIEERFVASQVIHRVVENFGSSLEDLFISWNFNSVDDRFPRCPNLKRLAIKFWSGSLAAFNEINLPLLKIFHTYDCVNEPGVMTRSLKPHHGVDTFAFECMRGTGVRFGLYSEEDFQEIIHHAQQQFPNITCLDLNLSLTTRCLQFVISNFPLLEKLLLDSDNIYEEEIFTGIDKWELKRLVAAGTDVETVPKTPCFSQLKELKQFVLSREFDYRYLSSEIVTDNAIIYCITKFQKMELLQFDWEPTLTPKVVQKFLKHIQKVVVNFADGIKANDALFELKRSMPQIQLNPLPSDKQLNCNETRRSSTRRPRRLQVG